MRLHDARYEEVLAARSVEYHDPQPFDRIAFAMRALNRLRAKRITIALYSSSSSLRVQCDTVMRGTRRLAIVGIPPHASREHIAFALAELAGVESTPYVVQSLLADERP